jgi:hypothetical protein
MSADATLFPPRTTTRGRPRPSPRRQPRAARQTAVTTLVGRLNQEWAHLRAAEHTARAVRTWSSRCPALAGLTDLAALEERLDAADAATTDTVLLALLGLARNDELAARVVLQRMLGKAVRLAGTHLARQAELGGADRDEAQAVAVAALWQVIRTYPVSTRPARVAANLALEALMAVHRGDAGGPTRRGVREVPVGDLRIAGLEHRVTGGQRLPVDAEVFDLLAWAVRADVLRAEDARLLVAVYGVRADGQPADGRHVAAELGVSWPALRQRCSRTVRRLAAAVPAEAA